jgi:hypothetical protein
LRNGRDEEISHTENSLKMRIVEVRESGCNVEAKFSFLVCLFFWFVFVSLKGRKYLNIFIETKIP